MIKPGDVVMHTFLGTIYQVDHVTPQKAECRQQLVTGMSKTTVMILKRNLVVISPKQPTPT